MDNDKVNLDFMTISRVLKTFPLPEVDHVVGIADGGIVPASLIAHQINRPMSLIQINYRARDNSPRYPRPVLLSWQPLPVGGQRILLVDEVSVSGKTMEFAKTFLKEWKLKKRSTCWRSVFNQVAISLWGRRTDRFRCRRHK